MYISRALKVLLKIYLIGFGLFLILPILHDLGRMDWPTLGLALWSAFKVALI